MIQRSPPKTPLPDDVLALMKRTIYLVNLLYWEPVQIQRSLEEVKVTNEQVHGQQVAPSESGMSVGIVPDEGKVVKGNKQGETGEGQLEDLQVLPNAWTTTRRCRKDRWFDTLDLEARKAYGRALMSGQGTFDTCGWGGNALVSVITENV
jgi:hypothetical protein